MSKSKYRPNNMGYKKYPRKLAQTKHRRRIKQYLDNIRLGKLDYEYVAEPSEVHRKKFFIDWYW